MYSERAETRHNRPKAGGMTPQSGELHLRGEAGWSINEMSPPQKLPPSGDYLVIKRE